jgi:hypothetical protein
MTGKSMFKGKFSLTMQPETEQPDPEEIVDEDTIDESLQEDREDKRDTVIESLLVRGIKKRQSDTKIKTVKATGPTSKELWIKTPDQDSKTQ